MSLQKTNPSAPPLHSSENQTAEQTVAPSVQKLIPLLSAGSGVIMCALLWLIGSNNTQLRVVGVYSRQRFGGGCRPAPH